MDDLNLIIIILFSISLNIIALMIIGNLINEFIDPYIILGSGLILFLYSLTRYYIKKWENF